MERRGCPGQLRSRRAVRVARPPWQNRLAPPAGRALLLAHSPTTAPAAASMSGPGNHDYAGSAGLKPARGRSVARTNGLDRAGSAGFLAGSWSKRSAYQRPWAQPVAHAPGKRWERRLEAGSWAQPVSCCAVSGRDPSSGAGPETVSFAMNAFGYGGEGSTRHAPRPWVNAKNS